MTEIIDIEKPDNSIITLLDHGEYYYLRLSAVDLETAKEQALHLDSVETENQMMRLELEQLKEIHNKLIQTIKDRHSESIRQINYTVKGKKPYEMLVPNEIRLEKRICEVLLESIGEKHD